MRIRSALAGVVGATVVAVIIAGCTSSGSGTSTRGSAPGYATVNHDAPSPTAAEPAASALAPDSLNAGVAAGSGGAANGASAGSGGSGNGDTLISDTRSVIRRAELTVGVKKASDVAIQANRAEAIVSGLGGDVFGDDRQSGTDATATLTLKVPPASLIKALNELSALGTEQSRSLSSQDVTTQVADVNARVASAAASIARLRTLYASATKVSDVIAIEDELSGRESDLESLQAQQKSLSTETQLATISLVLTTTTPQVVIKTHHRSGIAGALSRGWDHFISGGSWVVSAIAAVGPWVVLVLLLGAGLLRLRRRRGTTPVAPTPEAA